MDTEEIYQHGRARFEHAAAKRVLREKYQAKLLFTYAGGMWRAGPELQTTLITCPDTDAVIVDLYETPVRINTQELLALSQQHWQEQMTAWLLEYEKAMQNR